MHHFGRPRESHGFLPLLVAAMGIGRAAIGAVQANQEKQRNKGYINASYRRAEHDLTKRQGSARQGIAEALGARGLAQGGDVSASALPTKANDDQIVARDSATSLGGQVESDANVEMGYEQKDLTDQRDRALKENKTNYINSLISAGSQGIQAGVGAASAAGDLNAMSAASASRSGIHAALLSGNSFGGVHPNDPLGEPTSAWSTHPRMIDGSGQNNSSFNVG